MPKPVVIDLSHHNVIPDSLKDTAQSGTIGLIHKATEGGSYVDPTVGARQYLAEEAGLLWGLYHFLRPGDQVAHANHFCDTALLYGDRMTLLAADYEDYEVSLTDLIVWLLVVEKRMGRRPVIYSGHVLKDKLEGKTYPLLTRYRLWLAQYGPDAVLPNGWDKYFLWQYTDQGMVPGVTPTTDLNDGAEDDVTLNWEGATDDITPLPPEPQPAPKVIVNIQVPSNTEVSVWINGEEYGR
jgi:lysozyme